MKTARHTRNVQATIAGIGTNALLAIGKTTAGVLGHSQALIADGIESFADIASSLVVWRALVIAAKPADENHPYGHGKAEPIAAAVVGLMLIVAAIWIALESIHQIRTPHETPAPFTLLVLIGVLVTKELLFRRVLRIAQDTESSAVKSDAWHHRSDAITSLAAAIGIAIALIGGKGFEWADDVAALLASGIIVWNGCKIIQTAVNDLMDTAPPEELTSRNKIIAAGVNKVDRIEKCAVRSHGYSYFVDLHAHVDPSMSVGESHRIAHEIKDTLREEIPRIHDVMVHIEPSDRSNG